MAKGGDGKISNSLVAASCAAILAVYTAGYSRTRDAAEKFETQAHERRPEARAGREVAAVQPEATVVQQIAAPEPKHVEETAPAPKVAAEPEQAPVEAVATPVAIAPTPAPQPAPEPAVAPAPVQAPAPAPAPAPKWKDGTYTGWGTSRHGDIEARVVIHEGRIVEAGISQCLTRYSCDIIDRLIPQPVTLQSGNVDYVSGATESSDAYYFGIAEALEKASTTPKQGQ